MAEPFLIFTIYSGSSFAKTILELGERLLILDITLAVILVYLFAHITYNAHKSYAYLRKKHKKGLKRIQTIC